MTSSFSPKTNHRAIIRIVAKNKVSSINYSRRMYAIIRRYTSEAVEGGVNECYADLTGLRTFFKMTYSEMAEHIVNDLRTEIGISCRVKVSTPQEFESALKNSKKSKVLSTYKEINTLFAGSKYIPTERRARMVIKKRIQFNIPFLGKVK